VVMEACGSAHHWGREFEKLGHRVVLISPQYATPYVVRNKTDRADVKGILEAYRNSAIHPVPIKTIAQQQLTACTGSGRHGFKAEPNGSTCFGVCSESLAS
jgi:transposase